jgi:hypothetical protein
MFGFKECPNCSLQLIPSFISGELCHLFLLVETATKNIHGLTPVSSLGTKVSKSKTLVAVPLHLCIVVCETSNVGHLRTIDATSFLKTT